MLFPSLPLLITGSMGKDRVLWILGLVCLLLGVWGMLQFFFPYASLLLLFNLPLTLWQTLQGPIALLVTAWRSRMKGREPMELSQIPAAFHSKLRLAVIAALLSGPKNFRALQDLTGATLGNLGKRLEVLEAEGYLRAREGLRGPPAQHHLHPPPLRAGTVCPVCGPAGVPAGRGPGGGGCRFPS